MSPSIFQYLPDHADQLMKLAIGAVQSQQPGKMEKYMPWYGAAGGGVTGGHLASKVVPKKFKLLGQVAGTLAGTALGVHGGEAIGRKLDKTAEEKKTEEKKPKSEAKEVAKVVGKSLGGLTAGGLAGYGAGKAVEHGAKALGRPISPAGVFRYGMPIAGAGLGTAFSLWRQREAQELKRALEGT